MIRVFQQNVWAAILLTQPEILFILPLQLLFGTTTVIQALFDHIGVALNHVEMFRKIRLAETQADKLNLLQVPAFKRGAVIEGDIAAFHNQSLVIFNGCFDDLPDNWPQIGGQIRVVALRGEGTIAASDQPHFQMIDGEVRIAVPFQ